VVSLTLHGLSVQETAGRREGSGILDRLSRADMEQFPVPADHPDLRGYIDLALRGRFPQPVLQLSGAARQVWLETYVDQLVTRDAKALGGVQGPVLLSRYFEALCVNTEGIVEDKAINGAAGIARMSAGAYESVLSDLFVFEALPAWTNNGPSRLVKRPKHHMTDTSLVTAALRGSSLFRVGRHPPNSSPQTNPSFAASTQPSAAHRVHSGPPGGGPSPSSSP
jgi:hypothetical protein